MAGISEVKDADAATTTSEVSSELIVAAVPQEQGHLVCIQYPGTTSCMQSA